MHIVCPHCTTFYAIDPAKLGPAGRTVRCSRCKEIWLARPEEAAHAEALVSAAAEDRPLATDSGSDAAAWPDPIDEKLPQDPTPIVESPSIAGDWPEPAGAQAASHEIDADLEHRSQGPDPRPARTAWLRSGAKRTRRPLITLPIACVAMAALVVALMIWRVDVVRLLPQTAIFYRLIGLDVNLRGLAFKDVKISTETVDGKPILVIEGAIVDVARTPVELPRLRFIVRDSHGTEIYAWNALLEQAVLKPGETAWFRSRLASPPPEGRDIDIRFFNKRDILAGGA